MIIRIGLIAERESAKSFFVSCVTTRTRFIVIIIYKNTTHLSVSHAAW